MKRPPKYTKTKAVKEIARERIGAPKPGRVIEEKALRSKPKHKKRLTEEQ